MKSILAMLFAVQAVLAQTETAKVASIGGTIVDAKTLKPIPSALVVASRAGAPPLSRSTRSGGDGAFQIQGLAAGNFLVCVQAPGDQYLDPCEWNGNPVGVVLASGETASNIKIQLTPASILRVQIMDDSQALSQLTKDGRRPDLSVGVWGPRGIYYPARAASSPAERAGAQAGMRTHHYLLPVPRDIALSFYIASRDLQLGDANGMALPANASQQAFKHATGDSNPKSFTFKVLGRLSR